MNALMETYHTSVLLDEVVALAKTHEPTLLVDATLGGAGHASALAHAFPEACLVGLDRDPDAIEVARSRLDTFGSRVEVHHASFDELPDVLDGRRASFVIADLGVSSHQIDSGERGFSFRFDGPLDMRMDTQDGTTLADWLDAVDDTELADVIWRYGEERHSRRIARAIKRERPSGTSELADVVRSCLPYSGKTDSATRTFQALRIKVNDELGMLERLLSCAPDVMATDGVFACISFHSLEDRMVKRTMREWAGIRAVNRHQPVVDTVAPSFRLLTTRPIVPSDRECADNPRARSAKMRAAQRLEEAAS